MHIRNIDCVDKKKDVYFVFLMYLREKTDLFADGQARKYMLIEFGMAKAHFF
jgi:hypothetical protein